jgi:hypothetical protein
MEDEVHVRLLEHGLEYYSRRLKRDVVARRVTPSQVTWLPALFMDGNADGLWWVYRARLDGFGLKI